MLYQSASGLSSLVLRHRHLLSYSLEQSEQVRGRLGVWQYLCQTPDKPSPDSSKILPQAQFLSILTDNLIYHSMSFLLHFFCSATESPLIYTNKKA